MPSIVGGVELHLVETKTATVISIFIFSLNCFQYKNRT